MILHTDCGARSGDLDAAREAAAKIGGRVRGFVYDVEGGSLCEVESPTS